MMPARESPDRQLISAVIRNGTILVFVASVGFGIWEAGQRSGANTAAAVVAVSKATYDQNRQTDAQARVTDSLERGYAAATIADDTRVIKTEIVRMQADLDYLCRHFDRRGEAASAAGNGCP